MARLLFIICAVAISLDALGKAFAADDGVQLTASPPLVLKHPEINKSIGNPVHCLAFVNEGELLATGATSGVLVWDVKSGERQQTLELDDRSVDSLAVDWRNQRLVAGGGTGVIKVWDAGTFKLQHQLGPTAAAVRGLTISHDGKTLASTSPNGQKGAADDEFGIVLWDLNSGEQLRKIRHPAPNFGATALSFISGDHLLTAQDRELRLIDARGEILKVVNLPELPRTLGCFAIRGDERQLATGVFDMIRASGRKAILKCSFMGRFYASHAEYADIVDG